MGQTGADFGAVSTEGLIMRVKRKAETVKASIDAQPLLRRKTKDQRKRAVDATIAEIEATWLKVKSGDVPEEMFRAAVIILLDPGVAGGDRGIRFRW